MLALGPSTGDLIRAITGSAADVETSVSYVTYSNATPPVVQLVDGEPLASITNAATTTTLAGAATTYTVIKGINYANRSATSTTLAIEHIDASDTVQLIFCTLLQNESLVYTESGIWIHYDANAAAYPSTGNVASQAEMEAGTATDKYVSPGRAHFHPSAAKFWVEFTGNSTTVLASYNTTSITDGTTEATVTIGNDFSSANWCCCATATGTASTAAAARLATARSIAAGSVIVFAVDGAATTALADPSQWCVAGFGDL